MKNDITLIIQRQDGPQGEPYEQTFRIPSKPDLNIIACLQWIAANPVTADGESTTPVTFDSCCLEEVCGACSMLINGTPRQACAALVDEILTDNPGPIHLAPLTKFQIVRDLMVDREALFAALKEVKAWIEEKSYDDMGAGPVVSPEAQETHYPLSRCMSCGCCLEACPQYNDKTNFFGPHAVSQAVMFNLHPAGEPHATERLDPLTGPRGLSNCGNAQNCQKVCPKNIPLLDSIARAGRSTTSMLFKQLLALGKKRK